MKKEEFFNKVNQISSLNDLAINEALKYQDSLAKPPHSLGILEDLAVKLAGITGKVHNSVDKCALVVFASDNGVADEGVSSTPQEVTLKQTINLTLGKTGAATLSKIYGNDLYVIDVGVKSSTEGTKVIQKKIRPCTSNLRYGPAMSKEEAYQALIIGFETIEELKDQYDCFGLGEMGIGNTTTSAAVLSLIAKRPVEELVGKGAGLTEEAYKNKIQVIKDGIAINKPDCNDIIDIVSKVGGFDLISMAGAYLGCAYYHKPVVIDGFISSVAANIAARINDKVKLYLIPSHGSFEIGTKISFSLLGLKPLFNFNMRLGEGSGCPLTFSILKGACGIMNEMATFEESDINDDYLQDIRIGDKFSVHK